MTTPAEVDAPKVCNVCQHALHQLPHGKEWICEKKCQCLMIGCIPRKEPRDT